jgi:hypothetical protein
MGSPCAARLGRSTGLQPCEKETAVEIGSPNDAVFVGWGEKTAYLTAVDRGPPHARLSRAGVGDPSVKVKDRNGSLSPRVLYLSDPTGVLWHITDNRKA